VTRVLFKLQVDWCVPPCWFEGADEEKGQVIFKKLEDEAVAGQHFL